MQSWDETYDFVIVGSGGASMCAALLCKANGRRALIIEKQPKVGGSTGFSGGVWWIPDNPVMKRAGVADSYERAKRYFDAAVTYRGPASSEQRREMFLKVGPELVEFLERAGMQFKYADGWPDYYDTLPGGEPHILDPIKTWTDKAEFDKTARALVGMFQKNFAKFEKDVDADVRAAAPDLKLAAE